MIGDYVDRFEAKQLDFAELSGRLGSSVVGVLEAMITKTSVVDSRISDGMLVDYQYAEPRMDRSVAKPIDQKVYLDCSPLLDLYDPESEFIMIPVASPAYPLYELNSSSLQFLFKRKKNGDIHSRRVDKSTGAVIEEVEEITEAGERIAVPTVAEAK